MRRETFAAGRGRAAPRVVALLTALLLLPAALPPLGLDAAPGATASHATWLKTTGLPSPRAGTSAAWEGTSAYVFGGWDGGALDEIVKLTPASDDVERLDVSLPAPRAYTSAVWTGTVAFLFGGENGAGASGQILRFDPGEGSVTVMEATLLSPRSRTSAVWDPSDRPADGCAGGCAYVFGGTEGGQELDEVLRYNPEGDAVTIMSSRLPGGEHSTSAVWAGQRAYIFGGRDDSGARNQVLRYDPLTDTLVDLGPLLPSARSGTSAVKEPGTPFIYVLGGSTTASVLMDQVLVFDADAGTVEAVTGRLTEARADASAFWDGTNVVVVGGQSAGGARGTLVRFAPGALGEAHVVADLPSARYRSAAVWIGGKAYVFGGRTGAGVLSEVVRYDPVTHTVSTSPFVSSEASSAVTDGMMAYVFAGATTVRYDPATNTAQSMAGGLPSNIHAAGAFWDARDRPGAGCPGGCAYILGGYIPLVVGTLNTIYRYNPTLDQVTLMNARLPTATVGVGVVWDGTAAYVLGGVGLTRVVRFDPVSDAVQELAPLPAPRSHAPAYWDGTYGYLFGGAIGPANTVFRFDPAQAEYVELSGRLPFATAEMPVAGAGSTAYLFGGNRGGCCGPFTDDIVRFASGDRDHPPVAIISPLSPKECDNGRATLRVSGLASHDPEGAPIGFAWSSPGGATFDDAAGSRPFATAPLGTTPVKLRVSQGSFSDVATANMRVVDTIPPTTQHALDGTMGNESWWRSAVDVTLTATDRCGIDATFRGVDGAPAVEGTTVTVAVDGAHTVQYFSRDLGANVESPRSAAFKIDTTRPNVAIIDPRQGNAYVNDIEDPAPPALTHTILVGTKTVTAAADDATSGVKQVEFFVDGHKRATAVEPPYQFVWNAGDEALGAHNLAARAFDFAGNDRWHDLDVTTVPTSPVGLLETTNFRAVCRLVGGPDQCDALQETIEKADPAPTTNLLRDTINEFLRHCEETFSPTLCALLPDELPGGPAPSDAPDKDKRSDAVGTDRRGAAR